MSTYGETNGGPPPSSPDARLLTELHAWVSWDVVDGENVSALFVDGAWMPLVHRDDRPLRLARDAVQRLVDASGKVHRLIRIGGGGRDLLDELHPTGPRA